MTKKNYSIVATKRTETRFTLAANSEEEARKFARDICRNEYLEASCPRLSTDYEVVSCNVGTDYEPTYLVTKRGYYFRLENFEIRYDKADAVFCRTPHDMHTMLKVFHSMELKEVEGCEIPLRWLDTGKYEMTHPDSSHEVFEHTDIEKYIREFEI